MSPETVSVVIPIFNEAKSIKSLLVALNHQTLKPSEVIFVDSGSTDGTIKIIENFIRAENSKNFMVFSNPSGLPGGNRNIGIKKTTSAWIALIDAGIVPTLNWIESLHKSAQQFHKKIVFGRCSFMGLTAFEDAVCALSYGIRIKPVLPASLIYRPLFDQVGYFREDLRAAEDIEWLTRIKKANIPTMESIDCCATYNSFPEDTGAVANKWWLYQKHKVRSGIVNYQSPAIAIFYLMIILLTYINQFAGLLMLVIYLLLRGIVDPIRRSNNNFFSHSYLYYRMKNEKKSIFLISKNLVWYEKITSK
jgi:glycosyltransferase involved in cell wall biosynthesis